MSRQDMHWTYSKGNTSKKRRGNKSRKMMKEKIQEAYEPVLQGCFIDRVLHVHFKGRAPGPITEVEGVEFVEISEEESPEVFYSAAIPESKDSCIDIEKCLNDSYSKIVALHLRITWSNGAHANIIVFDRTNRTIELYDPNGYKFSESLFPNLPEVLSNILSHCLPSFRFYRFCNLRENNPKLGLQSFQASYQGYKTDYVDMGLCSRWIYYILQLRLDNYRDTPAEFKKKIKDRMQALWDYKGSAEKQYVQALGQYFTNYILDYMIETDKAESLQTRYLSPIRTVSVGGPSSAFRRVTKGKRKRSTGSGSPSSLKRSRWS